MRESRRGRAMGHVGSQIVGWGAVYHRLFRTVCLPWAFVLLHLCAACVLVRLWASKSVCTVRERAVCGPAARAVRCQVLFLKRSARESVAVHVSAQVRMHVGILFGCCGQEDDLLLLLVIHLPDCRRCLTEMAPRDGRARAIKSINSSTLLSELFSLFLCRQAGLMLHCSVVPVSKAARLLPPSCTWLPPSSGFVWMSSVQLTMEGSCWR